MRILADNTQMTMVTNESCDDSHSQNTLEYFQDKVSVNVNNTITNDTRMNYIGKYVFYHIIHFYFISD